jgi:hypothetical protein
MVQLVSCGSAGGAAGVVAAGIGTGAVYRTVVGPVGPVGAAGAGGLPQAVNAAAARATRAARRIEDLLSITTIGRFE